MSDNRVHNWISSQHSLTSSRQGADSPLLGFTDPSNDPLLFPSPDFIRDLPISESSTTEEEWRLDFLTEMDEDEWNSSPPPPPPPPPSPQEQDTIPPLPHPTTLLSRSQSSPNIPNAQPPHLSPSSSSSPFALCITPDEQVLLGSTRPRSLSRASGIAYTPPSTPITTTGRPRSKSSAHIHARHPSFASSTHRPSTSTSSRIAHQQQPRGGSHDRLPSISSTLSKMPQISHSRSSSRSARDIIVGPKFFLPSSPRCLTPISSPHPAGEGEEEEEDEDDRRRNSGIYLGGEDHNAPFPEASRSKWSLTTSIDEQESESGHGDSANNKKKKTKKGGKRQRLASFIARLGVGVGSGEKSPPPLPASTDRNRRDTIDDEGQEDADGLGDLSSTPLRLDLNLSPNASRFSVHHYQSTEEDVSSDDETDVTKRPFVGLFTRSATAPPAEEDFAFRSPPSPTSSTFTTSTSTSPNVSSPPSYVPSPADSTYMHDVVPAEDQSEPPLRHMFSDSQLHHPPAERDSLRGKQHKHLSTPGPLPLWSLPEQEQRPYQSPLPSLSIPSPPSSSDARSVKSSKLGGRQRLASLLGRLAGDSSASAPSSPATDEPPMPPPHVATEYGEFVVGRLRRPKTHGSGAGAGGGSGGVARKMAFLGLGERKKRLALVVVGVAREDDAGCEAVRRWCEHFGHLKSFVRRPNGNLEVEWIKPSVAETVCRLQAQVYIRGAGSVTLSSTIPKGRLGF